MRRVLVAVAILIMGARLAAQSGAGAAQREAGPGDTAAQSRLRPRVPIELQIRQQEEASALLRRGRDLRDAGKLEAALATFDTLLRVMQMPHAFAERGRVRARLGDSAGAMADLDAAVRQMPLLPLGVLARGRLRAARGDDRGAREDLAAAMKFNFNNPYYPEGGYERGLLRISLGDSTGGMDDVRAAAEMGWLNAQRLVAGQRPVPVESLEVVMENERDSTMATRRAEYAASSGARTSSNPPTGFLGGVISQRTALMAATAVAGLLVLVMTVSVGRFTLARQSQIVEFPMASGERQLWIGAPIQGVVFPSLQLWGRWGLVAWLAPPMVLWFVARELLPFYLFVTVVASTFAIAARFDDARRRKLTTYALTTKRAIVCVGNTVKVSPIEDLRTATLSDNDDGTGTIEWGSAEGDLQAALDRAVAEGRSPTTIDVRGIVSGAAGSARAFSHVPDANAAFATVQEVSGVTRRAAGAAEEPSASDAPVTTERSHESARERDAGYRDPITPAEERRNFRNALLFFSAVALVGATFGYFFAYPDVRETIAARRWAAVPCTILRSAVRLSRSSTGVGSRSRTDPSYDVDVWYKYEYAGHQHYGGRYQITPLRQGGFGAYERIQRKVDAIPAGSRATCYVDPTDPDNAVIERGVTGGTLLQVGIPGAFALFGLLGIAFVARTMRPAPRPDEEMHTMGLT